MSVVSKGDGSLVWPYTALYAEGIHSNSCLRRKWSGAQLQLSCQHQLLGSAAVEGHLHLHSMMVSATQS